MVEEKSLNIYEYIQEKLKYLGNEIAEVLLEGDAYFGEWEAISKILYEIEKFLDVLKENKKEVKNNERRNEF